MAAPKSPSSVVEDLSGPGSREKPIAIAKGPWIAESDLRRWMEQADVNDGKRDGDTPDVLGAGALQERMG